jgi:hypothetical protein
MRKNNRCSIENINERRNGDLILIIRMRNAIFLIVFAFYQFCLLCTTSSEKCGYPTESPILSKSRIVGGYPARKHSWPWIGKYLLLIQFI